MSTWCTKQYSSPEVNSMGKVFFSRKIYSLITLLSSWLQWKRNSIYLACSIESICRTLAPMIYYNEFFRFRVESSSNLSLSKCSKYSSTRAVSSSQKILAKKFGFFNFLSKFVFTSKKTSLVPTFIKIRSHMEFLNTRSLDSTRLEV